MEAALGLGAHRVTLEVRPSNQVAHKLYRKYGFEFSGMRKGYYSDGEDGWLMAADVGGNGYCEHLKELRLAVDGRLLEERIRVGREPSDRL
jgi:ribosomal protein S18 acetylase RimI-like enzyme